MLKKLVSLIVGTAMACAAVGVSANISVSTTSEYNSGEPGTIRVTSYVSGAGVGDILTYLAYGKDGQQVDLGSLTGKDIVYIDQKEVQQADLDETKGVQFTYVTESANVQAAVKAGGVVGGAAQTPGDSTITGPVCVVTVNGETTVTEVPYTAQGFVKVRCTINGLITEVTLDNAALSATEWFAAQDGIWLNAAQLTGKNTAAMTVTVGSATVTGSTLALGYMASDKDGDTAGTGKKSIIALGKMEGMPVEYGISIGAAVTGTGQDIAIQNEKRYPALGVGSDGKFVVKLYDFDHAGADSITGSKAYARVYWKDGETYKYGDIFEVAIGGTANATGSKVEAAANEVNQLSLAAEIEEAVIELPAGGGAETPADMQGSGADVNASDMPDNDQTTEPESSGGTPAVPEGGQQEAGQTETGSGTSADKTGSDSEGTVTNNGSAE